MGTMKEMSDKIRQSGLAYEQKLPGGIGDQYNIKDFDPAALAKGIAVEMEHTTDPKVAEEIAIDHLTEDASYYDKLEKMEGVDKEVLSQFAAKPISDAEKEGTEVQSLVFDKEKFDAKKASDWLTSHDFNDPGVDETEESLRYRQQDPGNFESDSFRTIEFAPDIKAVIGRLK